MASTLELIDKLEREKALLGVGVVGREEGAMDPLVAEALRTAPPAKTSVSPSSDPGRVDVTFGGALGGVTVPVEPVSVKPVEKEPERDYFYDLLMANDDYRKRNSEAFERNERATRARTRIAAVSDALSSLGNLVGTVYGAPSQEQTYQTPLINAQREEDLARARKLAQSIQDNDLSIRMLNARLDAANGRYGNQLLVEDAKTQREREKIAARAALAGDNHGYRTAENEQKAGYTRDLHAMDNASREKIASGRDATSSSNKDKDLEFKREELEAKKNGEIGSGGGGVAGYTTETTIQRDKYGRETGRTTTRTGSNGQTTTTTTTTKPGGSTQSGSSQSSSSSTSTTTQQNKPPYRSNGKKDEKKDKNNRPPYRQNK